MKSRSELGEESQADDLLLAIVHDVRAHLRSSLTNAQLLQRSAVESLLPEMREQLDRIVSANKDLDRFLSRISDFAGASHLGAGKLITLDMALQTALLQFTGRPVLLAPIAPGVADQRIQQEYVRVFAELIDNALKFSADQPVRIEVAPDSEGGSFSVKITDAGIGIDPDEIDDVFQPLTRLNARDQYPGAGLGLPICRRIAGAAGATVELTRSSGGGVIATVRFNGG